jgi:hypothetical protein
VKYNEMRRKSSKKFWFVAAVVVWTLVAGGGMAGLGQSTNVAVTPSADAFVWSLEPTNNYGGAGSLSVSGLAATNSSGQQQGLFDGLMRFPMTGVAAEFDGSLGSNNWVLTDATLVLTEVGQPNNGIFNRGVGAFEIRWIISDDWVEGTGVPITPTTNGVAYQDLWSVLHPGVDVSLGQYTNNGTDGAVSLALPLATVLVSNVVAGNDLNFYFTAASASVGFTFNSRNFLDSNSWPRLQIAAVARPVAMISSIQLLESNQVAIRFNTASNWNYAVQGLDALGAGAAGGWSNLHTVAAELSDDHAVFVDAVTNRQRFYRLQLSR